MVITVKSKSHVMMEVTKYGAFLRRKQNKTKKSNQTTTTTKTMVKVILNLFIFLFCKKYRNFRRPKKDSEV